MDVPVTRADGPASRTWRVAALGSVVAFAMGWFLVDFALVKRIAEVPRQLAEHEGGHREVAPPRLRGMDRAQPGATVVDGPLPRAREPQDNAVAQARTLVTELAPEELAALKQYAPDFIRLIDAPVLLRPLYVRPGEEFRSGSQPMLGDAFEQLRDTVQRRGEAPPFPGRFAAMGFRPDEGAPFEIILGPIERLGLGLKEPFLHFLLQEIGIRASAEHPNWASALDLVDAYLDRRAVLTAAYLRAVDASLSDGRVKDVSGGIAFVLMDQSPDVITIRADESSQLAAEIQAYLALYAAFESHVDEVLR